MTQHAAQRMQVVRERVDHGVELACQAGVALDTIDQHTASAVQLVHGTPAARKNSAVLAIPFTHGIDDIARMAEAASEMARDHAEDVERLRQVAGQLRAGLARFTFVAKPECPHYIFMPANGNPDVPAVPHGGLSKARALLGRLRAIRAWVWRCPADLPDSRRFPADSSARWCAPRFIDKRLPIHRVGGILGAGRVAAGPDWPFSVQVATHLSLFQSRQISYATR